MAGAEPRPGAAAGATRPPQAPAAACRAGLVPGKANAALTGVLAFSFKWPQTRYSSEELHLKQVWTVNKSAADPPQR